MDAMTRRHPKALPLLFLTELWERFGFYVVQGLLVLFTTEYFHFTDNQSYTIAGVFSGLVYISPFFGGILADRYLGFKVAILWGGLFLCAGYGCLALAYNIKMFYLALAIIIIGNGLFKPNISSVLGMQYHNDDPRRDAGFTIFYIGINIGSGLSGISGYLAKLYGPHSPFAFACAGMVLGLFSFLLALRQVKLPHDKKASLDKNIIFFICCIFIITVLSQFIGNYTLANLLLPVSGVLLLIYFVVLFFHQAPENRNKLLLLFLLIVASALFWALFFQLFTSANLYVERLVDKNFFGIQLSTTVFYASEGIFIVLLGPIFAFIWHYLGIYNYNPSPISKFTAALVVIGFAFLVLSQSTYAGSATTLIPALWVFSSYILLTIADLLLSPTGLSAITLLAPSNLVGMLMGTWFVAIGFGGLASGTLAKLASVPEGTTDQVTMLMIYHNAFKIFAEMAFVTAVILILANLILQKYIRQKNK